MTLVDFDDIVQQAHASHDQNTNPDNERLIRECKTIAKVSHGPADHCRTNDCEPTHCRCSRLLLMMLGAMIFFAQDWLTFSSITEERDQESASQ